MSNQLYRWRRAALAVAVAGIVVGSTAVRADDVEKPWDRSIALGLSITSGNSDTILFTGALKGQKAWQRDELFLALLGSYGKDSNHDVNNETLEGVAQYNHLFNERLYGYGVVDVLHDDIADLAYRLTVGPGVGYYFIKAEQTKLAGEIGGAYVQEKRNSVSSPARYFTLRLADRFEHKFNDRAKIWQQTEWLPKVDDFHKYLLNTEVGLEAALTKAMSLRVVGTHRYDSEPAVGRKNYDLAVVSALAYKF